MKNQEEILSNECSNTFIEMILYRYIKFLNLLIDIRKNINMENQNLNIMNNIQVRKNLTSDLRSTTSITSRKCLDLMILTYFDAFFGGLQRSATFVTPPLTKVCDLCKS